MTVKPFYIRHTPDMTDAQVAEVFDKAIAAGAGRGNGVKGIHRVSDFKGCWSPSDFEFFGVTKCGDTWISDAVGIFGEEIRLNQVDEWLGIAPKEPTIAERMAELIEKYKHKIPDWARWVGVCESGSFECWSEKPSENVSFWSWYEYKKESKCIHIGYAEELKVCWRETLTELKPAKHISVVEAETDCDPEAYQKSEHDQHQMILRDQRERSRFELDYIVRKTIPATAKPNHNQLTIPSTLPTEQAMPMMLGGDFGAISDE